MLKTHDPTRLVTRSLPVDVAVLPSAEDHVVAGGPLHKGDSGNVSGEAVHLKQRGQAASSGDRGIRGPGGTAANPDIPCTLTQKLYKAGPSFRCSRAYSVARVAERRPSMQMKTGGCTPRIDTTMMQEEMRRLAGHAPMQAHLPYPSFPPYVHKTTS